MRTIGAIVLNWNGEKFIIPHLKMLEPWVDEIVVIQGKKPWSDYKEEYGLSDIPDKSEELIRNFPGIKVLEACQDEFGAALYNQGLDALQTDMALRLDYDMFLNPWDMKKLIEFIEKTKWDCFRLNFNKCSINYYRDFEHGLKNAHEYDPIAVSTKFRFSGLLDYPGTQYVINWPDFIIHHFRGWKGKEMDLDYLLKRFPNVDWISCPQEIREML